MARLVTSLFMGSLILYIIPLLIIVILWYLLKLFKKLISMYVPKKKRIEMKYNIDTERIIERFNKLSFNFEFDFLCEYCQAKISSFDESCPKCGAPFGKNTEYINKRYQKYEEYLKFLKEQENEISNILKYISANDKAACMTLFSNKYRMKKVRIGKFIPAENFHFNCEFCSSTLFGNSKDGGKCTSCGAVYNQNKQLLLLEEIEECEKTNHKMYAELNEKIDDLNSKFSEKNDKVNAMESPLAIFLLIVYIIALMIWVLGFIKH